ncbi:MAG: glycosyltransferase family 4 protein [Candidatus Omnitrophica bacterium]|nr:glycosyltransferase family 4 protein [Candidatus Omnitrophota bacterium]
MKVFLMVPEMNLGGVEEGTFDLAAGLKKKGIEVTIISGHGNYVPLMEKANIRWINLPTSKKTPAVFFKSLRKLRSIIETERPEILHCRSRFPAWIGYCALLKNQKTRFVTSIHGFYNFRFYSKIIARGERVIAISDFLARYAVEKLEAKPENIRVVHNGIRFDPYVNLKKKHHTEFTVGGIGRLTKLKGFQNLIRAIAIARKTIPELQLWIIGDGPYKKQLECISNNLGVNAQFLKGRAPDFLSKIDLLVAPHIETETLLEGIIPWLGRSVYEAQLAEVPVLTTLNGIQRGSFIKTDRELICFPSDIEAMAEAIIFAFIHPEEMKKMARNGKDFVMKNFSLEQMVNKTIKVYKELL